MSTQFATSKYPDAKVLLNRDLQSFKQSLEKFFPVKVEKTHNDVFEFKVQSMSRTVVTWVFDNRIRHCTTRCNIPPEYRDFLEDEYDNEIRFIYSASRRTKKPGFRRIAARISKMIRDMEARLIAEKLLTEVLEK